MALDFSLFIVLRCKLRQKKTSAALNISTASNVFPQMPVARLSKSLGRGEQEGRRGRGPGGLQMAVRGSPGASSPSQRRPLLWEALSLERPLRLMLPTKPALKCETASEPRKGTVAEIIIPAVRFYGIRLVLSLYMVCLISSSPQPYETGTFF